MFSPTAMMSLPTDAVAQTTGASQWVYAKTALLNF